MFSFDFFFPQYLKKNVKTILSSQAVQIQWWAEFGPWATQGVATQGFATPDLGNSCVGIFNYGQRETQGLPWIHSPVTTAVFSPSAAPSYTFLLEGEEHLCDRLGYMQQKTQTA